MENQPREVEVTILGDKAECRVDKTKIRVKPGDTVKFSSKDLNSKISFPDPGIIDIKGCWETIVQGGNINKTVITSKEGTYYYAVMCEHDGEYWYAEGNTCPAMIVE